MAGMSSNEKRPADGLSRQTGTCVPKNAAQSTTTRAGAQVATREECRQVRQRAGCHKDDYGM